MLETERKGKFKLLVERHGRESSAQTGRLVETRLEVEKEFLPLPIDLY